MKIEYFFTLTSYLNYFIFISQSYSFIAFDVIYATENSDVVLKNIAEKVKIYKIAINLH